MSSKDLLTKNTGLCFLFSSSLNKAALTETSETASYTKSVSMASGLTRTRGSARYCFIAVRSSSHSSFYPAWLAPLRVAKNGFKRSVNREGGQPASQLLYFISRGESQGLQNSFKLSRVGFDAPLSYHESQESARANLEGAFHSLCPQEFKSLLQVFSMVQAFFGFYQHVVNINLHGYSQQWSEHFGY